MGNDHFIIEGCGGTREITGSVAISGSKNAVLPALAASLLFDKPVSYINVPNIEDIKRSVELLETLGANVQTEFSSGALTVDPSAVKSTDLASDIAIRMRASILFSGPLLTRHGSVSFPHPGGCVIGERPIDMFFELFTSLGADIEEGQDTYTVTASRGLSGGQFFLRVPSVTVTETGIMAGVLAHGTTVLENAAMEPEIVHLAHFLNTHGARIQGAGTPTITIEGVEKLAGSAEYTTPPDRLEAGSFLILGALCARDLRITGCDPRELQAPITMLKRAGVPIEIGDDEIHVYDNTMPNSNFRSFNIHTHEYPGFPTDLQAPAVVFLTQATGRAHIFETIFEGRLQYTTDLVRMGAHAVLHNNHEAEVEGPTMLRGCELKSPDIRAGLAFVIAALVAEGKSTIHDVYYIDRGYERIEEKLSDLGFNIERKSE